MKYGVLIGVAIALLSVPLPAPAGEAQGTAVTTYEHLATAIIEIRKTEDSLVQGMLWQYVKLANHHLKSAAEAAEGERVKHLEAAAAEVSNVANEGDKQIQAIRQRLLQAGHHHHTDAETQQDYMFIDSKEKKELLELAGKIGKLGAAATAADIENAASSLKTMAEKALQAE